MSDEQWKRIRELQEENDRLEVENEKLKDMLADEIVKAHALSWRLSRFMRDRYGEEDEK